MSLTGHDVAGGRFTIALRYVDGRSVDRSTLKSFASSTSDILTVFTPGTYAHRCSLVARIDRTPMVRNSVYPSA